MGSGLSMLIVWVPEDLYLAALLWFNIGVSLAASSWLALI